MNFEFDDDVIPSAVFAPRALKTPAPAPSPAQALTRALTRAPAPAPARPAVRKPVPVKPVISAKEEFSAAVRDVRVLVFEGEGAAGRHKKAPVKKAIRQFMAAKTSAQGAKLEKGVGHGWKHMKEMRASRDRKMAAAAEIGADNVTSSRQWLEPQEAERAKQRRFKEKRSRQDAAKLTHVGRVNPKFLKR